MLALFVRFGALKRPGLILGAFALFYGLARSLSEFFSEPDAQLGFLWGGPFGWGADYLLDEAEELGDVESPDDGEPEWGDSDDSSWMGD